MDKFGWDSPGTTICMIVLSWPLVLQIFNSAIKTWRCKGCLKPKLLEHAENNIFLFASVPKAAEPFSSKIIHTNCLRRTLSLWGCKKFQFELLTSGNKQLTKRFYGGLSFLLAPTCIMGLQSASEYSHSSVCHRGWWGDAVAGEPRQPRSARKQSNLQTHSSSPVHSIWFDWKSDKAPQSWGIAKAYAI